MKNSQLYLLLCFLFVLFQVSYAQPPDVTIDGKGSRQVEPASRLTLSPQIIDTVKPSAVASYPLLAYLYPTEIRLTPIKAAEIETTEKLRQLYPFYAKIGMGSGIMPLGQFIYNSTRSKGYHYGVKVDHISSFAKIKDRNSIEYAPANYDRTGATIYGKMVDYTYMIKGELNYLNNGFNYYGIPSDTIDESAINQRFQRIGANLGYVSDFGDSAVMNYAVDLGYHYLQTASPVQDSLEEWRTSEHNAKLNIKGWYNYKSEEFYANLGMRLNNYRFGVEDSIFSLAMDSGRVRTNSIIDFKPGVLTQLMDHRFKLDLGFSMSVDIGEDTKFFIYPQAEVKYSLFNDIFIPFAGIRGGLSQNSFSSLSQTNQFLAPSVRLLNENNPYDIYGGIKGTLSKRMGFNANVSFKKITNKALFVTDTMSSLRNKFGLVYDTMNHTRIEASLFYQLDEKLKLDGMARFNSYETNNQAYAWNLPVLEFQLRAAYNLFDKFMFNLDGHIETGRKALVYEMLDDAQEIDGQYYINLGGIIDFNLGVSYRYNKRITAFFQLNNMLSQRYNDWYNYPVQPIQVMGGVSFRF
ncbi:MAG: hypothetical protein CMP00_04800 [Woeseiaceae bacterium]|mgnify:CR=1 FL=1|nr:hypothetical protein [Woeseiaceae bacterium]|tara:strand:- start:1558 stop:3291 length:1734 start_codon:yes stop_codon:yes gene_type:complete